MTSLNISLPQSLKAFAGEEAVAGGYTSVSEYLRELLKADQKRKAEAKLEALLLEGINITPAPKFLTNPRCGTVSGPCHPEATEGLLVQGQETFGQARVTAEEIARQQELLRAAHAESLPPAWAIFRVACEV